MKAQSMQDYRVELDAYNGPLDLLLFLVRRNEIDLHDIPIARLTDQYLEHLKLIQAIDVDLAGEFLVMSATLLEIKSQMLIPVEEEQQDAASGGQDNPADPRYELVQQLLAYKRYKDAAMELDDRRTQWEARVPCHPGRLVAKRGIQGDRPVDEEDWENQPEPEHVEVDLEDASVADLCAAFARILSSIGEAGKAGHQVVYDDTPIGLHAEDIMDRLTREGPLTLHRVFAGRTRRVEMIGLFLAMLELVRLKKIRIAQSGPGSEIALEVRPPEEQLGQQDSSDVDWRDPQTGQMQYEWPTEEARKRAERRQRLRALAAERRRQGLDVEDDGDEDGDVLDDEPDDDQPQVSAAVQEDDDDAVVDTQDDQASDASPA